MRKVVRSELVKPGEEIALVDENLKLSDFQAHLYMCMGRYRPTARGPRFALFASSTEEGRSSTRN